MIVAGGVDESGTDRVIPSLVWLVERLSRRHELFVYVLRYHGEPRTYQLRGATVRDLGRPEGLLQQYRAILRAVRRDGPLDLLHGFWALPSGFVAAAAARWMRMPSVVTCDSGEFVALPDIDYGAQRRWRQRATVWAATRLATRVVVCSKYQASRARTHGVDPMIIPMGVDTTVFKPAARAEGPPWRLLHVASLNPVKDQRTLLEAFAQLVARGVDAHLDIAGEDTMAGAIQHAAERLGVSSRVTFHGVLTSESLAPLYQRSHLFVLSSRHEAAGVVLLEAAASRVPIAGTSVGYLADWAPHGAQAVPPRDPAALATAIDALLRDRGRRDRLAASAREWTVAHNADWTAGELDRLYRLL